MCLFTHLKWIKLCFCVTQWTSSIKAVSQMISLSKPLNNREASGAALLPHWELWRDFKCVCGKLGISVGLLNYNLTPHKDSNSLNTYETVPLLPQHFMLKFTCLSRLYSNSSSDLKGAICKMFSLNSDSSNTDALGQRQFWRAREMHSVGI